MESLQILREFLAHSCCRARTRIIKHTHHPIWEEAFQVPVADQVKEVGFLLKDASYFGENVTFLIDLSTSPSA